MRAWVSFFFSPFSCFLSCCMLLRSLEWSPWVTRLKIGPVICPSTFSFCTNKTPPSQLQRANKEGGVILAKITTPLEPRGPVSYRESTHILYPVMSVRARFRCAGPQDTSLSSTTRPRSCRFYTRLYWVMVRPRFLCAAPICFVSSFIMPFDRTIVPYNYGQMTAKYLRWFCHDRGCGGTGDC